MTEPVPSGAMDSGPAPLPLRDERVLKIVGRKLADLAGQWQIEPGPLLKGPGTFAVRVASRHSDSFRHVDLEFLLSVNRAAETSLVDCATGFAADPEQAIREAVAAWAGPTSGAKQQWFADTSPWTALAPVITTGLSREYLNGFGFSSVREAASKAARSRSTVCCVSHPPQP